mgnify:CR=1 FL=1
MNETSKKSIAIVANLVYGKTEKFCFCQRKFVKMNGVLHCLAEIKTNFHDFFLKILPILHRYKPKIAICQM